MTWQKLVKIIVLVSLLKLCPTSLAADHSELGFFDTRLSFDFMKPQVMNLELRHLAAKDAINCGRVHIGQDPSLPTDCGLKAFAAKKAFYVRYDVEGIDTEAAVGFSFTDAKSAYTVTYVHSLSGSDSDFSLDPQVAGRLTTVSCLMPIKLVVTKTGFLTCSPNPSKAKSEVLPAELD